MKTKESKLLNILLPLAFGILFILLWQFGALHAMFRLKIYQLPLPSDIAQTLAQNYAKALTDCGITVSAALIGMALGSLIGFGIALIATCFPKWGYGGMTVISAFNAIPIVALSPIMNCWFSTGMAQKVGVVTVVCMAAMALNAYNGLNILKPFSMDLMYMTAASKWTIFTKLRLPNCLPNVFTACKINVASSIIAAIISEYFASSTSGLGFGIKDNLRKAEMAMGWSYIVVASIAGVLLFIIVTLVERNAVKWHASQR
ncbi:MAG TPA: ABC transporter permease subunit [Oscillospiraceae bacterium]|nr:ABC transporter permease subunit [Oscillospiraceae bacterium]